MSYEIKGNVILVNEPKTYGKDGVSRSFVLGVIDGKYPQKIQFECKGKSVPMLDSIVAGDDVSVKFSISGREWNGKYYTSLVAWNVKLDAFENEQKQGKEPRSIVEPSHDMAKDEVETQDEIPF
jgi:hypothetical protein